MKLQGSIARVSSVLLCLLTCQHVQAGPVLRSSRMVREIYPEVEQEIPDSSQVQGSSCIVGDTTYPSGSPLPSSSPCLKCSCVWGSVRCEAEACAAAPGCRTVARPGRCCPAYECECEHQGRVYANGQRLPQPPGHECSVCYCRGGHVQCAEVGCYTRHDCAGRYVQGECCPKYDHCPPRDSLSDRLTSPSLQTLDQELLSTWQINSTSPTYEGSGDDDILSDEPKRLSTPVTFSIKEIEGKGNKKNEDNIQVVKVDKSSQTDSSRSQITIQEVTPPRQEYIPPSVQGVQISPANPATSTGRPQLLTDSSNELDAETYASERSEVYDHPPPVLRIGDQLLFIKQGQLIPEKDASTPSPVITLIGAEGLQIGLGSGEVIEQDILPSSSSTEEPRLEITNSSEEETTKRPEETTETIESIDTSSEFITVNITETTEKHKSSTTEPELTEYIPEENPYYPPIPEDIMNLGHDEITTDITSESGKSTKKTDLSKLEPKSAKPELSTEGNFTPDITVIPLLKQNKTTDSKILPEILELRNNQTINGTSFHQEWLKTEEPIKITIPLLNEKAVIPDEILALTAASDLTTEENEITTILDTTTHKLEKIMAGPAQPIEAKSKETLELKEELFDSIEYTTLSPKHSSLISSEDASVEMIPNDSKLDTSDLVEMVPGFEQITQKSVVNEEHLKIDSDSPKGEVEMIDVSGEKLLTSHVEMKEEKQKRDVVKKVLKDTFENPKENIRTDIIEDTTNISETIEQNEELNIVKPNLPELNQNVSIVSKPVIRLEQTTITQIPTQTQQKVTESTTKTTKETTDSLGEIKDYLQSQYKQLHNTKIAD